MDFRYFHKMMNRLQLILKIFLLLAIFSCSSANKDSSSQSEEIISPDPKERAKKFAEKGGGLLGDINNRKSSTTFEFSTSNVLWRATLKSLDFLPIANADYSGGVIVYDWYSESFNSNEAIKISIKFLNNEVRSDSLNVTAFKRICNNNQCQTQKLAENFSNEIKNTILNEARLIKISEVKK